MGCGLSTQRTRVSPVKNSVAELRGAVSKFAACFLESSSCTLFPASYPPSLSPITTHVLSDAPENAPEPHTLPQPFTEHLPQQTSTHHSLLRTCTTTQQSSAASNTTVTVHRHNIFIKGLTKRSSGRNTSQPSGSKLPRREMVSDSYKQAVMITWCIV